MLITLCLLLVLLSCAYARELNTHSISHHVGGGMYVRCLYERETSDTDEDMQTMQHEIVKYHTQLDWQHFLQSRQKDFEIDDEFFTTLTDVTSPEPDRIVIERYRDLDKLSVNYTINGLVQTDDGHIGCIRKDADGKDLSASTSYINISGPALYAKWIHNDEEYTNNDEMELTEGPQTLWCAVGLPNVLPQVMSIYTEDMFDTDGSSKQDLSDDFTLYTTDQPSTKSYDGTENGLGEVKYTGTVQMTYKDHNKTLSCEPVLPSKPNAMGQVRISMLFEPKEPSCPYMIKTPIGQKNVKLSTRILSNPKAEITWHLLTKDGETITDVPNTEFTSKDINDITSEGTISISSIGEEHYGEYVFSYANEHGNKVQACQTTVKKSSRFEVVEEEEEEASGGMRPVLSLATSVILTLTSIWIL